MSMNSEQIVQGLIDRADARAAETGLRPENRDAFVVGWLRGELANALDALGRCKSRAAKDHLHRVQLGLTPKTETLSPTS